MLLALSPMDGITDPAFREITDKYGKPNMLFTEFIPAEGLEKGAKRLFPALLHHKTETTIIAQFFGISPHAFYISSLIAFALGYDGVDINMGCPDRNIGKRGGGGALIGKYDLARKLIAAMRQAADEWNQNPETCFYQIPENYKKLVTDFRTHLNIKYNKKVTVSVKTRIGLDTPITNAWISFLCKQPIDMLSLHGRTMLQMYRGNADWNEIAFASRIAHTSQIVFLGNGDIKSKEQAIEYAKKYDCDGVLIGRAALGNPWIFSGKIPSLEERFETMQEHCRLFLKYKPEHKLFPMRKHLAWYCKEFNGCRKMKDQLMKIEKIEDVKQIISQYLPQS